MKNTRYWNEDDAKAFVKSCLIWIGPGFHPDTPMEDYVVLRTNQQVSVFTTEDAAANQVMLDKAFELLGDDIYEAGMELGYKLGYYPRPEPYSPIVPQMPSVAVLFGQEAIEDYNENGDAHAAAEKHHGAIEAYEFETEAEKQAFIYGLSEACHWDSNCLID
jgi:hypothetical protein